MTICLTAEQLPATVYQLADQLSERYLHQQVTDEALKIMGFALWQAISSMELEAIVTQYYQHTQPLALIIDSDNPAINQLPWECLYHPTLGFLGKHLDYALSRRITTHYPIQQPPAAPLRILLFSAQTAHSPQTRLDIEGEQQAVYQALYPFVNSGLVQLIVSFDGRFSTFAELLRKPWHIVILSGHGVSIKSQAHFVFESEEQCGEAIAATTLVNLCRKTQIQCLVLAVCQSHALATQIAQSGVQYVIGMREPVLDRASRVFIQTLCTDLVQQIRVDIAVQRARQAMTQLLAPNEIWCGTKQNTDLSVGQWNLPILLNSWDNTQDIRNIGRPLLHWDNCQKLSQFEHLDKKLILPELFIGRRQELRTLTKVSRLIISGAGGMGKTALARQLATHWIQQDYRLLTYQANTAFLTNWVHMLNMPIHTTLEELIERVRQDKWLIILDNLERIQHRQTRLLRDNVLYDFLNRLENYQTNLVIILISRCKVTQFVNYHQHFITSPDYTDFLRYTQQLGLPHPSVQMRLIYRALAGNFKGLQLLQSLPICTEINGLMKQLTIVQRYLRAYQKP